MKICFVTSVSSHYRVKLFECLAEKFDVQYYFFSDGNIQHWEKRNKLFLGNYKGENLNGFYIGRTRITLSLIPKLIFGEFDIVIKCLNGRFALPVTFLISKLRRKPFVLWQSIWHHPQTCFHKVSYHVLKWIWRHTDAFVVYGAHMKNYLIDQGIDAKKIFIAWNTIDNDLFNRKASESDLADIRKELGLDDRKVILYVGRIDSSKGVGYLLEAFARLNAKDAALLFIGEGDGKAGIVQESQTRGLQSVRFLSYIQNAKLYLYYALADVFVLPSVSTKDFKEPWGLVINEAMNQACPIVATDAVGAAVGGLVENGANGYVVPERDSGELARALDQILSDENLRREMGKKSLEIIKGWTYPRMAKGFEDAVAYALNHQKRAGGA